jgi:arylsulfatase A-like enzyme
MRSRSALLLACVALTSLLCVPATPISSGARPAPPNIVLILTDDQRWDLMADMPILQTQLVNKGVTFTNAFAHNPLCCPSRASLLTGKYSHTTGVWRNGGAYGGYGAFKPSEGSTVATWLHDAGYRTALIGKYLNGYTVKNGAFVPPGWDRWVAYAGNTSYYNYRLSVDGVVSSYGAAEADYSTDVLAQYATDFISTAPADQQILLWFTPFSPHTPQIPAPRHVDALPNFQGIRPPNLNEADVSDKPQWVQALTSRATGDRQRKLQAQALLSVDDAIGGILGALEATGRLSNTLIVFASDNGLSLNSHRWNGKLAPWEESIRVPFVIRYDPMTKGVASHDDHLVVNVDAAPTFAEAARVAAPGAEGRSLLKLLKEPTSGWRDSFVLEHYIEGGDPPTYCGVRTTRYKYIEYSTGEEELYDLQADPYELESKHADPAFASLKADLHARMVSLCSPPPPGFTP